MLGGCRIVVCSTCLSAKAAARRGKIQVEMWLFMASVAVIFSVDFTGPHILVVMRSKNLDRASSVQSVHALLGCDRLVLRWQG
jgi:heme/copper-type cytochrome/quinol oxidase subunit 3